MEKTTQPKIEQYERVKIQFNTAIPPLKKIRDKTKIDVRYCLVEPFSYVHIYWDKKNYEIVYDIEEPVLDATEEDYKKRIISAMKNLIDFDAIVDNDQEKLLAYIDKRLKLIAVELGIAMSYETYAKIYYYLVRDFIGFNEVDPLLRDYFVEDIECNGVNSHIYIVHRQYRNIRTNVMFTNVETLSSFIEKLAQRCGKYISYANPILDGSLPDGSRVNATYTKDISSKGPTFTIRKFTKSPWTPPKLLSMNTLSPEMLAYLWLLVEYRMNILITGGTSSGKTTLLNAVSFFIPPEARIVSIEDTRELNLPQENWLPSVVRGVTGSTKLTEIDLFVLLKSSFRQNPDYVIVGEVRGKETYVLFQGMASGHSSISTIHADSVDTVIKRLETPPIELSPTLLNVLDCICIMTHAIVQKQETRKLREVVEIINVTPDGVALTNTPFMWNAIDDKFYFKKTSKIFEKIQRRYGIRPDELDLEFRRRVRLMYELYRHNIIKFDEVREIVRQYYKKPKEILHRFGIQF